MLLIAGIMFAWLLVGGFSSTKIKLDGDVLILDDLNFDEALNKHDQLLVEFYAPWCGHCKTLAPEWAKAATSLKSEPMKLAKCDATVAKDSASKYGISGFPTIKLFKKGVASDYEGGRTEKEIVQWVKKKMGPATIEINTLNELEDLQIENEAVAIGVFSNLEEANTKTFLEYAAGSSADIIFAVTSSESIRSKLGISKDTLVILTDIDDMERSDHYLNPVQPALLDKFILKSTTPLIQEFNQASSKKIFANEIKKHALMFINKDDDNEDILAAVKSVAEEYKGQLLFVSVDSSHTNVLDFFDLKDADLPTFIIADMTSQIRKFPLQEEFSKEAVYAHVKAFASNSLKPVLKSEEPSPEDLEDPVKILRGKSFKQIVLDNDNDVFVEIYAPWCGHCKKIEPVYDELGEHFDDNEKIVIAKMDGTTNEIDIPGFEVQGYPSLFFKNGETRQVTKYSGGHELDDLIDYIEENAYNFIEDEAEGEEKDNENPSSAHEEL